MRENLVQHEILKRWGAHSRVRFARINTGVGWFANGKPARRNDPFARPVRFNPKGTADIVGLIAPAGKLIMIECKRPGGKQSPEQAVMQRVVTQYGGLYILAYSVADVDRALAALGITR